MSNPQGAYNETAGTNDLPPPYSSVVGNPQYGFIPPSGVPFPPPEGAFTHPKSYTAPGVYPHPPPNIAAVQMQDGAMSSASAPVMPVGIVVPPAVGSEPATVTCINCGKVVTTRITHTTAWHTHLVAGSICVVTMMCSLCCLGLVPYCFDTFKDVEHYCPNCNSFIGKSSKC